MPISTTMRTILELVEVLKGFKGKFLLILNDCCEMRDVFSDQECSDLLSCHKPFGRSQIPRFSGEGGIRTRGTVAGTQHFQCCTIGHSVTPPDKIIFREIMGLIPPAQE